MSLSEKENSGHVPKKKISLAKAKERIAAYCAYQERCISEVRNKLEEFGLNPSQIDPILEKLAEEGFLNENRFAEAFVRGRFTLKKWGRVRIRQELKMRDIPEDTIQMALNLIDSDEYWAVLQFLAERKWKLTQETNELKKRAKVQRFLVFRGFENDLIRDVIEQITKDPS
ncbi:regulatory protein RecX [Lunatibacter salilacus]|uniref:regulatory protein RecX n=1 Tax=Lunatibacter salilacus TaxID=2483804 RepID=UPI00131B041F|nr:regulatory protein RecX [Lunatibacter salilacus]